METKAIPVCPDCGRKTIYFRKDGSIRCTACGYEGNVKGESKKND